MGRWSHAVAAGHARLLELALRQERSALHFTMVDNISGAHFARQRHRDEELVYALGAAGSRAVTKFILLCFELRSSSRNSCVRARDGVGRGRGVLHDRVGIACQTGCRRVRGAPAQLVYEQRKHDSVFVP